tara:strand:+ start:2962 stop:3720 length:759 start_codon:yes stop_codon:yes gene_type:complete
MGLTEASAFKDNSIVNVDIKSDAAIAQSKVNLSISNAEVASNAAIDLSKLATATLPNGITVSASNISDLTAFLNSILPTQSSNSGKYLTTNGTNTSWGAITFPSNSPAFRAYRSSNQNISDTTLTIVEFNTEEFDASNVYDNSSTYKFTPNVSGYYLVTSVVGFSADSENDLKDVYLQLFKNNSTVIAESHFDIKDNQEANEASCIVSAIVQMNGSSDYLTVKGYIDRGSAQAFFMGGATRATYFQAFKLNI